jgi:putative chitinase
MNRKIFFDQCRAGLLGPTLDATEVSGTNAVLDAIEGLPLSWQAYALATAYHETAHTMQPIMERGGPKYFTRMYDVTGQRPALARSMGNTTAGDGPKYCGRGYVQLTWKSNYERASRRFNHDMLGDPDLAMRPDVAALIMRSGMVEGWFTGKSFSTYLPASGGADTSQYRVARRIINGTDKAALIADYASRFQAYLQKAGVS